jgi:hypothetical protein
MVGSETEEGIAALKGLILREVEMRAITIFFLAERRRVKTLKKYMLLSYGFEKPTPEIMQAWGKWFETIKDRMVDEGGHFSGAREISKSGTKDLPMGMESITGYTMIQAENLDEAEKLASTNPYIASIRVYEIMSK